MDPDERAAPPVREVRLEGTTLLLAGAVLLALLAGAFLLGRWTGPMPSEPAGSQAAGSGKAAEVEEAAPTRPADYFDRAEGKGKTTEPERQVGATSPPAPRPTPPIPVSPGSYFVQVFAGRDRRAAEALVRTLTERGHPVRLDTQREGGDALFKVRVGGFKTQEEARTAADGLKREGIPGAWVTEVR